MANSNLRVVNLSTKVSEYHVTVNFDGEFWFGECTELPNCLAQGRSIFEFIGEMTTAIEDYTASLREDNLIVPAPYPETISTANHTAICWRA